MSLLQIKKTFAEGKLNKWEYIDKMFDKHSLLFEYPALLQQTDIDKIELNDEGVVMTFRSSGVKMFCSSNDKRLAPFDALNFGSYEQEELQMQVNLMDDDFTIFDVGGNYGWYAIHIASRFPKAKIFSFEPIPDTYHQLVKNIALNHISNINSFDFGFSDKPGSFSFFYDPALSANASMKNVSGSNTIKEVTCKVNTIDDYNREQRLTIDFIKCDVEGAELMVFKGAEKTIAENLPIIFSEMLRKWTAKFNYHPNDIIAFLSQFGYQCFTLDHGKLHTFGVVDESTLETNYFFLHPEKHAEKIKRFTA
ncbi:FkbM family methyltransferase [Ohtaekwangia sp.]|uniref:FkbM family methyltransferase n=1 Tax=Ohtaekwangia sp. TaxID=2066019 RepID=UPI002F94F74D